MRDEYYQNFQICVLDHRPGEARGSKMPVTVMNVFMPDKATNTYIRVLKLAERIRFQFK